MKEINHNTLKASLQKLPEHQPPADLWDKLAKALLVEPDDGFEKNTKTLQSAIQRLPQYNAPYALWEEIEQNMNADEILRQNAKHLRQYAPPTKVWDNIETALDQNKKPIRISLFYRYAAAAALLGALVSAWWLFSPQSSATEKEFIAVSQQQLDSEVVATIREEDPAFKMVQELCQDRVPVCEKPEFKVLKTELDELTQAKQELRMALGNYGDDPNLSSQLVKIEQERSELLKQMIQMI